MPLHWDNQADIAQALIRTYPEADRLSLSMDDVRRLILTLPDFCDHETPPNDAYLRAILAHWIRLDAAPPRDGTARGGGVSA